TGVPTLVPSDTSDRNRLRRSSQTHRPTIAEAGASRNVEAAAVRRAGAGRRRTLLAIFGMLGIAGATLGIALVIGRVRSAREVPDASVTVRVMKADGGVGLPDAAAGVVVP